MIIKKEFTIDLAHRLQYHKWKCVNVHWHTYRIILYIEWPIKENWPETGMVLDFGNTKAIIKKIEEDFDHAYIYKKWEQVWEFLRSLRLKTFELNFEPTAENMAEYICNQFDILSWVEVFETPTASALYLRK